MRLLLSVVLLTILGVAIAGWFRPAQYQPPPPPRFTDQQVAEAKTKVCAAYRQVRQALNVAGARNGGADPTATLAVATSSRQALDAGSRYLLSRLAEEPATNADLVKAVRQLACVYEELTISYLADASDADIDKLRKEAERPTSEIDGLCK
jgi:NH3-dependent NAD+ synthetase